jgi:hypothetical protein
MFLNKFECVPMSLHFETKFFCKWKKWQLFVAVSSTLSMQYFERIFFANVMKGKMDQYIYVVQ